MHHVTFESCRPTLENIPGTSTGRAVFTNEKTKAHNASRHEPVAYKRVQGHARQFTTLFWPTIRLALLASICTTGEQAATCSCVCATAVPDKGVAGNYADQLGSAPTPRGAHKDTCHELESGDNPASGLALSRSPLTLLSREDSSLGAFLDFLGGDAVSVVARFDMVTAEVEAAVLGVVEEIPICGAAGYRCCFLFSRAQAREHRLRRRMVVCVGCVCYLLVPWADCVGGDIGTCGVSVHGTLSSKCPIWSGK